MDVYEVSGNEKALETAKGMGDWVYARMKKYLPKRLLACGTDISLENLAE